MHSRIYQLSTERLPQDEWIDDLTFIDNYGQFNIDYTCKSDDREDDLEWLKKCLPKNVFKMEGDKITILNNGECLFNEYKKDLLDKVNKLTFETGDGMSAVLHSFVGCGAYDLSLRARRIIDAEFLFSIESWNFLDYSNCLVEYAHSVFKNGKGKTLYVNGILDYHF